MNHAKSHPIESAVERTEDAIHDLSRNLRRSSHKAEDAVTDAVEALGKAAQNLVDEMRLPAAAIRKDVARRIEQHPIATAGLAAAALALAGLLLSQAGKADE